MGSPAATVPLNGIRGAEVMASTMSLINEHCLGRSLRIN
jgi:hypothetical protein